MKVIYSGFRYELENLKLSEDNFNPKPNQVLQFVRREIIYPKQDNDNGDDGNPLTGTPSVSFDDGTTNEEVLSVLIHRLKYQNTKQGSKETAMAITSLESALLWLNERANGIVKNQTYGSQLI